MPTISTTPIDRRHARAQAPKAYDVLREVALNVLNGTVTRRHARWLIQLARELETEGPGHRFDRRTGVR